MKKILNVMALVVMGLFMTASAFGNSDRVYFPAGSITFGGHDYTLRPQPSNQSIIYSAGLEIVYANLCNYGNPPHPCNQDQLTRCFLHVEASDSGDTIQVNLHDYNGIFILTLCEIDPPFGAWCAWPQCVKLDPDGDTIWFSYTLNWPTQTDDHWYSIPWDETLAIYPVATPTHEFRMDCNWEVEWSTDEDLWTGDPADGQGGRPFFAGLNTGVHGIWVETGDPYPNQLQEVVRIGDPSCGFAFDNKGNLWSGFYDVAGRHLYMWTKDQIDDEADANDGTPLNTGDATVTLDLKDGADWYGCSDVESDPEGNLYISGNASFGGPDTDNAIVFMLINDGVTPWPVQSDMSVICKNYPDPGQWDWFRSLRYDGLTQLDHGGITDPSESQPTGNRLYIDMDYWTGGSDADVVVGVCVNDPAHTYVIDNVTYYATGDADSDSIPDSLDNAPETKNGPCLNCGPYNFTRDCQYDTNNDMYGNVCDADVDNDNSVAGGDFGIFLAEWGSAGPDTDFDNDGSVAGGDFNLFRVRYNTHAPFK